jgi:DNA-binding CsgD family transcriptional regulator
MLTKAANQSEIRLTLRQLVGLGLPTSILLPSALAAVRDLVGAEHMGYFFCDEQGNITNMYAERMLSPTQMAIYHRDHYGRQESNFKLAYLKRVRESSPLSTYSLSAVEKQSEYYKQVLAPLGIGHFLYAVVRVNGKAVGQLSAYRSSETEPFGKADQQSLLDVLHYIERLVDPLSQSVISDAPAPVAETAMVVLDDQDSILYSDAHWDRLLRMAYGGLISPGNANDQIEQLPRFLKSVLDLIRASNSIQHTVKTEWGTFRFRLLSLAGPAGKAQSISVSRQAEESIFVAEAVARLKLPVQQREVAVLMTQGRSNAQIATKLGISVNTVNYHVKALFTRLNIHDRGEVLAAITKAVDQ